MQAAAGSSSSTAAASPALVTHGLTLKGAQLSWAILERRKPIENRHIKLPPGWIALHTGQGKLPAARSAELKEQCGSALPDEQSLPHGFIIGAIRIDRACMPADCSGTLSAPWATGPICNVIGAVVTLHTPVEHKGALGLWPIRADVLDNVRAGLGGAAIQYAEPSMLPPLGLGPPRVTPAKRKRKQPAAAAALTPATAFGTSKKAASTLTAHYSAKRSGGGGMAAAASGAAVAAAAKPPAAAAAASAAAAEPSTVAGDMAAAATAAAAAEPPSVDLLLLQKLRQMAPGASEARARSALLATGHNLSRACYELTRRQ